MDKSTDVSIRLKEAMELFDKAMEKAKKEVEECQFILTELKKENHD